MANESITSGADTIRNIGVLYIDESGKGLTHPFFGLILESFKQEMDAHNCDITFISRRCIQESEKCLEHCRKMRLDGVCLVCVDFSAPEIQALAESEIPSITIDHVFKGVPSVLSDNETGVQKLVEYAVSRGHRRIAFIHGHNNSIVTKTRIRQFHTTMDYNKIPVPATFVREGQYHDINLTRRIVGELLRLPERPTCILLPDDVCYLGAQDAARALGMRIPEDISFAGYDGIPLTQALTPRLTTIRQNCDQLGKAAAQRLLRLIEKPGSTKPIPSLFPVDFIEGETIASL